MHKAFPLPGECSHWPYNFPLPVEGVPIARIMEIPLQRVCTAMMKKLPTGMSEGGNALAWWKAYKQAKGGDAWLVTVTWADFKKLFFLQFFPRAEQERLKREYHSIRQTSTETSTEFMQHFLRLAGFLGAAAGTEEEQAKNFQWGLRRSTLNHLMCMSYMDVAQVANTTRNYEILHERDDEDTERPDKRQRSGDRHQPTSQQSSYRSHGQNNDRQGSDRRGGSDSHRSSNNNNNNYSGSNNRNSDNGRDQRNRGHQSNRSANS
nr:zinc finger, CCHC-type, retrotransposon Gag domain protein [Tanacetum cinerariifolium]